MHQKLSFGQTADRQQSSAELEFIEGWGLSCWLYWCGGRGGSSGARGQRSAACTQQLS